MPVIDIELSEWQRKVFDLQEQYRYVIIAAGRQSGKTFLCVFFAILHILNNNNQIVWWVAPIFSVAAMAMRRIITFCIEYNIQFKQNKTELRLMFLNGSEIWFKSAEKEEGLRGESVNFLIIDEIGYIKRNSWEYALRGTITATNAKVVFIGTPKGKNLFHELYIKGLDSQNKEYQSFHFTSRESPFFSQDEWEEVKKLPVRIFQQEYQAEFIDDGGEVFRNINGCIKGDLQDYNPHWQYYAGIDLAKSYDFTVICILDNQGRLAAYDRFNDISWTVQKQRIIDLCKKYDAYCLLDSTGLGDPILDDLSQHIRVEGYKFSNISKRQLIEKLAMAIERNELSFPEIPELINELNIYTFEQTTTGVIKYNAPEGLHDDIVISLALANWIYGGGKMSEDITDIEGRQFF